MAGGSRSYPYGSTSRMRADTLVVLGVLKVATADQIQRLARPAARDNKSRATHCWTWLNTG